ncbi:hypothetical protein B0H19DRAFT_1083040 [Mycena capillaripes]|nr:hypothetical protein B0H19DRAFT_1083040 [Mycena capillaripes]
MLDFFSSTLYVGSWAWSDPLTHTTSYVSLETVRMRGATTETPDAVATAYTRIRAQGRECPHLASRGTASHLFDMQAAQRLVVKHKLCGMRRPHPVPTTQSMQARIVLSLSKRISYKRKRAVASHKRVDADADVAAYVHYGHLSTNGVAHTYPSAHNLRCGHGIAMRRDSASASGCEKRAERESERWKRNGKARRDCTRDESGSVDFGFTGSIRKRNAHMETGAISSLARAWKERERACQSASGCDAGTEEGQEKRGRRDGKGRKIKGKKKWTCPCPSSTLTRPRSHCHIAGASIYGDGMGRIYEVRLSATRRKQQCKRGRTRGTSESAGWRSTNRANAIADLQIQECLLLHRASVLGSGADQRGGDAQGGGAVDAWGTKGPLNVQCVAALEKPVGVREDGAVDDVVRGEEACVHPVDAGGERSQGSSRQRRACRRLREGAMPSVTAVAVASDEMGEKAESTAIHACDARFAAPASSKSKPRVWSKREGETRRCRVFAQLELQRRLR